MNKCLLVLGMILLLSCGQSRRGNVSALLKDWLGREVFFPKEAVFTIQATDTVAVDLNKFAYKIVNYVDTTGCTTCRLQLSMWDDFWTEISSVTPDKTALLFFLCPKDLRELKYALKYDNFKHPVCVDLNDNFNQINKFPANSAFHTFLLNEKNQIVAMGNPINNLKVRSLYLKIIRGETDSQEKETPRSHTSVEADRTEADMGSFYWREERMAEFTLKNTGDIPLVIHAVNTSCGCTRAEYDAKPARPGESIVLRVTYKADNPGHFRKLVTVYCNTEEGMLRLMVTGEAEDK